MQIISTSSAVGDIARAPERIIIPEWQRGEVWSNTKKQMLIDSILRGIKLPKLYFAHVDGTDNFEVVDGQQRLAAIRDFINGKLPLSSITTKDLNLSGNRYSDLPPDVAARFNQFALEIDQISDVTPAKLREFFLRLQEGKALVAIEKLNAVHSSFRDYTKALANHRFFSARMKFANTRMAYFDIASKTTALAAEGLDVSLRPQAMEELFERQRDFSDTSAVAQHMQRTFDFLSEALRFYADILQERPFVQSTITLASQLVAGGESAGHEAAFGKFMKRFYDRVQREKLSRLVLDADYAQFLNMSRGLLGAGPRERHRLLVKKMEQLNPGLAELLAPTDGKSTWIPGVEAEDRREFMVPPSRMTMVSQSIQIGDIEKERDRYICADWQRDKVWNRAMSQQLIDTMLQGWTLPKFYFAHMEDDPEHTYIVEGQQRLDAIQGFIDNKFALAPTTTAALHLSSGYFRDLPPQYAAVITNYTVQADEISGATLPEVKDLFLRLQQGMRLTSQEKLNAVDGGLRDFAASLVQHPFFQTRVDLYDKRHAYFDITSKVIALEISGVESKLKSGTLRKVYEANRDFSPESPLAQDLNATLDFLARAFPENSSALRNRSTVQSVITLALQIVRAGKSVGREADFGRFVELFDLERSHQKELGFKAHDRDYFDFNNTMNGDPLAGVITRDTVLKKKLSKISPDLVIA